MRRTDTLIIGAGPAGCAAAITLACAGQRPLLLERHATAQQIVCGGFLSQDSLALLGGLGIDPVALGARPITRLRLIAGRRVAEAPLPFAAAGLSRATLDAALRHRAVATGAVLESGRPVRAIEGGVARFDGDGIAADAIILATGKHDLRGAPRPRAPDSAVGLRTRLTPTPALTRALAGMIELHLFRHGYAGLLIQEDGQANLCLSVARSRLAAAGGTPAALLAALARESPIFADRLGQASAQADWQAIAGLPYGWRDRAANQTLYRIGDQAAVIASLAGDGIAIALASGRAAATARLTGTSPAAYAAAFAARAHRPLLIAGAGRRMAEGGSAPLLVAAARIPGLVGIAARLTRIGH
ncbi:Dehydrogenase (flavoprotein) [Sphingomonas laterariae]|uniref:Dehydrogenase (Flavoprotein) n=1 Tax=Edaphosphingomonas laterariae TaxID=861865 RepID=A0A239GQT0_9SPHN|nr:FAD-dependent monooxygenase [Sphingomonas laterariae]SNS71321.1 Dehydrogenase (flavoprotein) [Sphingomonas laterariae]